MTLSSPVVPSYKKIWQISLPIMLSMLAQNIISITDTAFLGHVGEVELGAAAIGGVYYYVLFMIGFGFATGMQILISRRNGERNYPVIGQIMENGIFFLWIMAAVLIILSINYTSSFLPHIITHQNVAKASADFLNIRIYGLFFAFFCAAFRAFHVGITNTRPLTYGSIIMASINVVLNYLLVFGKFGFPKMGLEGAALASVISEAVSACFFAIYNSRAYTRHLYKLFHFARINFSMLKHILEVSIFVMLQYFISLSTWLTFFIMIEKTGEQNLASSNIIRSVYGLIGIPVWAYAAAVSSFVSNAIGAGHVDKVLAIIRKMVKLSIITAIAVSLLEWILAVPTLSIFTDKAYLIPLSLGSLYVVLFANIVFSISCVPFNGLSGTGRTKVALAIEILALAFYVVSLIFLTRYFAHNPAYIWLSEFAYWGALLVFTLLYLKFGRWRETKI